MIDYPLFSEAKSINYVISPDGITPAEAGNIYQWSSIDDDWHVNLSRQFVSLFCTRYAGYELFDDKLHSVLDALHTVAQVPLIDRVGVRYVNRLSNQDDIANLGDLIRPEVLGYQALHLSQPGPFLQNSTNQATYSVDSSLLQVRSGILPPGQTVDPSIEPLPSISWVLDLDASKEVRLLLGSDDVAAVASRMSDTAYDFFRLVTTEGFMNRFAESSTDHDHK